MEFVCFVDLLRNVVLKLFTQSTYIRVTVMTRRYARTAADWRRRLHCVHRGAPSDSRGT